jgi:hypothetical protein
VHDPDYRTSLKDFTSFVECLTQKVVEADETIPELPVKDIVPLTFLYTRFLAFNTKLDLPNIPRYSFHLRPNSI